MAESLNDLISSTTEAVESSGGFKDIKTVQGVFASAKRVPPNPKFAENSQFKNKDGSKKTPNDQVEITLTDAVVLETESGNIPDLPEGKFVTWINYAPAGKLEPHKSSFFVKGFMASAETLWEKRGQKGKGFKDLLGEVVVLTRQNVELYKYKENSNDTVEKSFMASGYVFGDAPEGEDIIEYAKNLVLGKTVSAALRELMLDPKTKKDKDLIAAARGGTLAEYLSIKTTAGKYTA